jgi:DNA-binding transcriptional ArsR family regulator
MVKYQSSPLDLTFAALSDPSRRAMLARLANGDATVGELARPFSMSLPAVTKHLNVLQRAGLITRERDGRMRRCHLRPERLSQAMGWIEDTRRFWDGQLEALARHLENTSEPSPNQSKPTKKE